MRLELARLGKVADFGWIGRSRKLEGASVAYFGSGYSLSSRYCATVGALLLGGDGGRAADMRRPTALVLLSILELSAVAGGYSVKEPAMATEPKRHEPDIPEQKPDIQPEPTPQEIPQNKDVPEKQTPPMQI